MADGTFESSIAVVHIKQIIAEQAARVVLLADHTKFGQRALCKALDIQQIHEIITDPGTSEVDSTRLEQHGLTVRVEAADQLLLRPPARAS